MDDLFRAFASFGVDIVLMKEPRRYIKSDDQVKNFLYNIQTLDELKNIIINVECDLKKYANNLVFGEGNEKADVVLIGEAPGADEDQQGRPFVGQSGQLLTKALEIIGLKRSDIFITNIVPWRPPMNRTPTLSEINLFLPFVRKRIEIIKPKIILCVGATSAKAILGNNSGIMKIRGLWFDYEFNKEIKIITTFHPAYLLRSPSQKKFFWRDLIKLKMKLDEIKDV